MHVECAWLDINMHCLSNQRAVQSTLQSYIQYQYQPANQLNVQRCDCSQGPINTAELMYRQHFLRTPSSS